MDGVIGVYINYVCTGRILLKMSWLNCGDWWVFKMPFSIRYTVYAVVEDAFKPFTFVKVPEPHSKIQVRA